MVNPTGGFGLRPVRRLDSAGLSFQTEELQLAYNDNTVIAQGDLVKWLNTGFITLAPNGTNNNIIMGVFWGCTYLDPNLGYKVWRPVWNAVAGLASTNVVKAYVYIDRNIVYEIRANGTTKVTQANIGNNIDVVVGTPTVPPGMSVALADQPNLAVTTTFPLRIVGLGQGVENDNTLANNIIEVTLNGSINTQLTGL